MPRKDTLPELVFATQNPNKIREIQKALEGRAMIRGLEGFSLEEELPETGQTLEANALQKARFVAERLGIDCFADDTGLEVEALNGAPGVLSARYAGDRKDEVANRKKLLSALTGKPSRKARFRTVIALVLAGRDYLFEGFVDGEITEEETGSGGFGYDPVFRPFPHSRTFGQMSLEEKNALSHRVRAVNKLVEFLAKR
ncbi:MAG: RdgB/HAM1 family non-canonical purine NTP pyrophosphatase [Bacteroidia bacterium]|nr:RdgB/HAM1 family non-canonical purine NTP pyrophosphatase [Bacteroidia bacterium]